MCEIYSKVTIKTPAQRRRFHTLFWCFYCCLEQVIDGWDDLVNKQFQGQYAFYIRHSC